MTTLANRILQIILYLLLAASAVFFIFFYLNGESMTDAAITWAEILLIVTLALLIIFPVIHFIKNPKSLLKFLGVIAIFAVLYFISYLFSSGNIQGEIYEEEGITVNLSRIIGSGLIMMYILAGLAVLAMIVSAIINAFK